MEYSVVFTPLAENQFKKLDGQVRDRIIRVLDRVKIRPQHFVEKLVGEEGYKLKIGREYRAYLDIDNGKMIILVLKVGHRRNFYKK